MTSDVESKLEICNCLALRQAARHVTRFYEAFLFPAGLRTTQFSILAKLRQRGPLTITAQRKGLVAVASGRRDHRSKELDLTETGLERLRAAAASWRQAQQRFETLFGLERASALRQFLQIVSVTNLTRADAAE